MKITKKTEERIKTGIGKSTRKELFEKVQGVNR